MKEREVSRRTELDKGRVGEGWMELASVGRQGEVGGACRR